MLKESFIGHYPIHLHTNPIVRVFIISEMFIWSALNFIMPIFAIFASTIPGGSVAIAASAYSGYMIMRVIFSLVSGKFFSSVSEYEKFGVAISGTLTLSIAYLGFAFTNTIPMLFICYGIIGIGMGIIMPVKLSLFSTHLDKKKEAMEWGIAESSIFLCIALSSALGGFIATTYGFKPLFFLAAFINLFGIIPYVLYLKATKNQPN